MRCISGTTVAAVNADIRKAMSDPEMISSLSTTGLEPVGNTPEETAKSLDLLAPTLTRIVREANIKVQ